MSDTVEIQERELLGPQAMLDFVFGGAATFTLVSKKTGKRFTFKMAKAKNQRRFETEPMFFASLLTGPDNTSDYHYLGFSRAGWNDVGLRPGQKGNPQHPAYKALSWFITSARVAIADRSKGPVLAGLVEFWHAGRCCKCNRLLTDPVSIERGVGPECAKKGAA